MNIGSEIIPVRQNAQVLSNISQSPFFLRPADTGGQVYELSGATNWSIDQASFDQLLCWLNADPEIAGQKYEIIRRKLIRLFASRQCIVAEDLADETFNRVTRKLSQIKEFYAGNPLNYFLGVAKKVYLEYLRRMAMQKRASLPEADEENEMEEMLERLEYCMGQLPFQDKELILAYYQGSGRSKIENRKKMAQELGISLNTLRLRAHRIVCYLRKRVRARNDDSL